MRNFAKRREYSIIPIALLALFVLVTVSPAFAEVSHTRTIEIVGQDAIWGGPNTYIKSTYRFGTGPVFVESGSIVRLESNADFHTLTLVVPSDLPSTAVDAINCGHTGAPDVCAAAFNVVGPGLPMSCYDGSIGSSKGQTPSTPCILSDPYNVGTFTNGDMAVVGPGQTLYLQIIGTTGSTVHFMCAIHPWMQGEFIITA